MEGRKLRRQVKEEKKPKQVKIKKEKVKEPKVKTEVKPNKILTLISRILIIVLTVIVVAVLGTVIYLKVLPNKYLIPMCIIAVLLLGGGIFMLFRKKGMNIFRMVISTISMILIVVFSFVGLKLIKTMDFLGTMTTETVNAKTYSVVVLKESEYTKLEDLQYRLLLYYDTELNQNQEAINKLAEVMTIVTEKTDNVQELANKLIANEVDAILVEDSYYAIIEEDIGDFREKTTVVYTFTLEDTIETIAKNVSVTKEPFNVFISGIDSYGKISSVSRSDVNMVVSVNPQTKQVLLVNIPRDYYVKLHGTSGYRDKLTHAGIYGIDMSVKTVEDLFDIDINYYVRVNFNSLINIIDAIGGVNVYSEYNFTSKIGNYKFVKGYNQMNGKQALGFARERYSFAEGDRMRGQNQQAVIDAVIKKVCSSTTILTKFDALLDSLKGSFQTNMDYTKMIELVRMQISEPSEWNVTSIGIDGSGSMERTYSMGKTRLSVLIPYAGSINKAESMINSVLDGEILEGGHVDISDYNDYLVVSRGVYEDEEEEKEPEKEPEVETPNTGEGETTGGENAGGTTGDSGNTGTTTPGTEDDETTSGENAGGTTGDGGNTGTITPETGEGETTGGENAGGTTGDSGNTGTTTPETGEGEITGNESSGSTTPDSGSTSTDLPSSGGTETTIPDAGNTGETTTDSGSAQE